MSPQRQALIDVGLHEVGVLYEALAKVADINPREADEMFIWECAMVLGVGAAEETGESAPSSAREAHLRHARELNRQRLRHAQGQGPAPSVRSVDPASIPKI